ncbi:MAG: citrate synthase [Clostridiales bacterium]|nr:citrate synthase [Clostridiales bacterium]
MFKGKYLAQFYGKSQNYTDIPNGLFKTYNVKKGLRNEDGTGVRVGLTRVSDVVGYDKDEETGEVRAIPGKLYYRGYDVEELVKGKYNSHFGYEEVCFLLLFGYLPKRSDLDIFCDLMRDFYQVPDEFVEMNLLRMPGKNLMNKLQDSVLTLYNYDDDPDNIDVFETLLKGINLMAKLPSIACYAYQSKVHYYNRESLVIHYANPEYSIAENFLSLLRKDQHFSDKEARLLDTLLMLHADHGGGNNSTFTNVVIASTDTDIYSTVCGSIGSMKGPRHGGANIKVAEMMDVVLKEAGGYDASDEKLREIAGNLMDGRLYDRKGLIYGFGHAVYTISDPRAEMLRSYCKAVAQEKDLMAPLDFRMRFENAAREVMKERKGVALPTNVDYYSGFVYEMLGIPRDLYTPLFVCSRVVGWVAHNIENKLYDGRIMRPATKYVGEKMDYINMEDR